ncbi:MAG: c-type cytochrome biogenesis protein CcmI [Bauldia sp.]|nr:c-type cytochrome biogenesis protein CcmI [Bauldia sp.]
MTLWIVMAVLAAAVSLTVLVPLFRSGRGALAMADQEVSVYRDQLGELDRDLERGVIAPAEAEAARTEIARRLIRADGARQTVRSSQSETPRRVAAATAVVAMPLLALGLYVSLGNPGLPDAPLAARLAAPPEQQDIAVLVAKVERHLAANPDDLQGWRVLAPIYVRSGNFDAAAEAFRNIVRIAGSSATTEGDLGEAILRGSGGAITAEAQAAFERALKDDPKDVRARFYLALADAQAGRPEEAATALRALIAEAPPGATWTNGMREMLAEIEGAGPDTAVASTQPGPTAADIEAAGGMSSGDRTTMIEGMVAQLAARLQSEPEDAEGWARLVRSYMVLGRPDDARAALDEARSALAGAADKLALVENEARATGLIQ